MRTSDLLVLWLVESGFVNYRVIAREDHCYNYTEIDVYKNHYSCVRIYCEIGGGKPPGLVVMGYSDFSADSVDSVDSANYHPDFYGCLEDPGCLLGMLAFLNKHMSRSSRNRSQNSDIKSL